MADAYHIALAACLAASLCWLAVLLRVWIRMRDELRRERDLFRDAHITTCRQLREAIEDGQAARAELRELSKRAVPGNPRAIAGQSSGQSGWIRAADALPDYHDEEVVALAGGCPVLAHYSPEGGWHDCYWRDLSGVTHWARWPEGSGVAGGREDGSGLVHRGGDRPNIDPESLRDRGVAVDTRPLGSAHPVVGGDPGHTDGCGELFDGLAGGGEE